MTGVAGVDGCRGGWVAVWIGPGQDEFACGVAKAFGEVFRSDSIERVAVDMPIGLPDRIGPSGRGPEVLVRPLLGARRNSVFAVPSRAALAETNHAAAIRTARATSDPPRGVSAQAFQLFAKIREIDSFLRAGNGHRDKVHECHPEVSFRMMKGAPLLAPKKTREGTAERRALLLAQGFPVALIDGAPPKGAGCDDLLDACAAAWSARRIALGLARSFPEVIDYDAMGSPIAIWA